MPRDEEELHISTPSVSHSSQYVEEEEATVGEELTETSHTDNWLFEHLLHHKKDDHTTFDERAHQIFLDVRNKIKAGPKPSVIIAEEKKEGIERQLEDNSKQLNALLEFGDILLTNVRIAREAVQQSRRDLVAKQLIEMQERMRQERIESDATYEMIKGRWVELNEIEEPVALFDQIELEKQNVDALMARKEQLINECQEEINYLNFIYDRQQKQQNHDLDCLGSAVLHQFDLISKCVKGHLEMLESTVEDEWQYLSLCNKKKFDLLFRANKLNEARMNEMIKDKEQLYAKELVLFTRKMEDKTRMTRIRLEKEAEHLELELRQARMDAGIKSEKLDYNYQVLLRRNGEDVLLGNQQKRRLSKICETIGATKAKLNNFLNQSKNKYHKLKDNIEKLHSSITEIDYKKRHFLRMNKLSFDKIWKMQFTELESTLKQVLEIDRLLYEQQLAQEWVPIEIDFEDINAVKEMPRLRRSDSRIDLDSQIHIRENQQIRKRQELWEMRFLRNVLRLVCERSAAFCDKKILKVLETCTEEDIFVVNVHNVFRTLNIDDMEAVHELATYFKPYAWCPNCQEPPKNLVIDHLYAEGLGASTSSSSANLPNGNRKQQPCNNHHLVVEPMLVVTALMEFERKHSPKKFSRVTQTQRSTKSMNADILLDNEDIEKFWSKFENAVPNERLKVWRLLKHGLSHFQILLEDRIRLDKECMKLSQQNYELRYFMGEQDQQAFKAIEEEDKQKSEEANAAKTTAKRHSKVRSSASRSTITLIEPSSSKGTHAQFDDQLNADTSLDDVLDVKPVATQLPDFRRKNKSKDELHSAERKSKVRFT